MHYTGVVIGGSQKARELGFPTLNIAIAETETISGAYIAQVEGEVGTFGAVCFADTKRHVLESHLFDFNEDWYGKDISVTLIEKIRDQALFPDETALRAAIARDAAAARDYFKTHPCSPAS